MVRWILVAVFSLAVTGAAWACDAAKNASASTKVSCSSSSTVKTADADADCKYCDLITDLKSNQAKVEVATVENKDGVTIVFAAASKEDVALAQQLANSTYELMSGPAHCSYTRSAMAKKSCGDCVKGVNAFAGTDVKFENTDKGAWTQVSTKDEKQIEKLHAFFKNLQHEDEVEVEG